MFLSPIWFFALAAIGIPVAIHLWNVRPGRTLKVGSISLISEASKSTRRSFKLLDILLLLVRCLLLVILAFVLAQPLWRQAAQTKQVKGWVLLPHGTVNDTYRHFKPQVDSLLGAGYELHFLDKNLTRPDVSKTPVNQLVAYNVTGDGLNYWELIRKVAASVPQGLPVKVFSPNDAEHFKGTKPVISSKVTWQTYTRADSAAHFIAAAWLKKDGNITVSEGNSTPGGTVYTRRTPTSAGEAGVQLSVKDGRPFVRLKDSAQQPFPVDTATLNMAVYSGANPLDARYLTAALNAALSFMDRKAVVKVYDTPVNIRGKVDWLFWLSDQPVPVQLAANSKNLFKYAAGKLVNVNTTMQPGEVRLARLISAPGQGEAIWQDASGRAVLGKGAQGQNRVYTFYSRFNPASGDLVWSDEFPKLVLKLLTGDTYAPPALYDRRVLSTAQIQPKYSPEQNASTIKGSAAFTDLSRYLWLALVLAFLTERILAHKTQQANG